MRRGDPEMTEVGLPIPAPLQAAINSISALLIAYLFIVVLMVAAAQQRVSARLTSIDATLDYSSSSMLLMDVQAQHERLKRLTAADERLQAEEQDALDRTRVATIDFDATWDQIAPIASRASVDMACGTMWNPDMADDMKARMLRARDLRQCLQEGTLPPVLARQLADTKLLVELVIRQRAVIDQQRRAFTAHDRLMETRKQIETASRFDPIARKVERSFAELNALTQSWLIGGSLLLQFPPSMLQIILAFSSGMFGALLVTLVLVVYPKNHFSLASHGHYGARTLLGGLIAVCVYVVLSGGTTVLGTSSGFADGQANYMTFCAVGVLAGMFSDRVASWLSNRANTFFRTDQPEPPPPPAKTQP